MSDAQTDTLDLVTLAADMVGAYVSNNHVQAAELPKLISDVHAVLVGLGTATGTGEEPQAKATAPEIRRSITPDYLVSFEDGKQYKTLRRHLTLRGLTPEGYRAKWGLAHDYPMTSAKYSEQRSELARSLGLGQQRRKTSRPASVDAAPEAATGSDAAPKAGRGRPRKAA
jgi:predicted transcriptional regulator